MKKILLVTLSALSLAVFAQKPLTIDVSPKPMSKDTQLTFLVEIPQIKLKAAEKDWLKYVGNGSKGKAVVIEGENLQIGAVNKNISANPFNVNSKLLETSVGVRLTVWLTQNNVAFISREPNNGQALAVQKYIRDFAVIEYKETVQIELKDAQDKQKGMEKELAGLIKDEDKSIKKVSENDRSTVKANDAIVTNNSDIKNSSDKINDQKKMVDATASDPNANKGAQKTLSELENEKENLQKQNEKQDKNINSMDKENRSEERNKVISKENQTLKMAEIEKQKQIVQEIQIKLNNIQ